MRGGGDEFDDMFEEETVVSGPLELQCPSCGGLISLQPHKDQYKLDVQCVNPNL